MFERITPATVHTFYPKWR